MTDLPELQDLRWRKAAPGGVEPDNGDTVDAVVALIRAGDRDRLREQLGTWPEPDLVELLVAMPLKYARRLFELRDIKSLKVIGVLNPALRSVLLKEASVNRIVEVLDGLEPEDAARAMQDLPPELSERVAPRLAERDVVAELLSHGEESAGSIMSRKFVAVPADWTIGMVTSDIRRHAAKIEKLYGVSVVDPERRPIGYLKLRDLLLHAKERPVRDVMRTDFVAVTPDTDREQVAEIADRYELSVVPVVDADGRLVGRITPDKLRQIIRDEAEEDIKIMAGLAADSRPDESVLRIVRGRAPWLLIGLAGASIAAGVVGAFEDQLAEAAILAVFIPIVMSTAGNAGIQASTVAVQGLATGTLTLGDLGWRLTKELSGALLNGLIAASVLMLLVIGMAQFTEFESPLRLALSAGLAELVVIVAAVAMGATVPLVLDKVGIDPAMATGVFITTGNDILAITIFFVTMSLLYLA